MAAVVSPVLLALVVGLVVLVLMKLFLRRSPSSEKEPPVVKTGLPVVGTLMEFSSSPFLLLRRLEKQYGQTFTLDLLFDKLTFILGREGNKTFFDATDDILDFNSAVGAVSENVLGEGVFDLDPVWTAKSNGYITKGFMRHERLNLYSSIILDETKKHVDKWMQAEKVDLFKSVSQLVTSINIRCVMGDDAYNEHAEEIASLYYQLELSAVDPIAILFPKLPTLTKMRNAKARKRLLDIFKLVMKKRPDTKDAPDYLGMVWNEEKDNHNLQVFVTHMLGILFAAHTNTAGTTAWTLAQLAAHKSLREKALREQKRVAEEMDSDKGELSSTFISKLEYLDSCMKETVRRYGMLMLVRKAVIDTAFATSEGKEFTIPKGRMVFSSPALTHFNEELYPEPFRYDPDRWADPERKQSLVSNRHYVQFGYGRHRCLGERFANLVIKTAISYILQSCQIDLLEPLPEPDYRKQNGTPGPERPIWARFTPSN